VLNKLLSVGVMVMLLLAAGGYFAANAKAAGQEGLGNTAGQAQAEAAAQQEVKEQVPPKATQRQQGRPKFNPENQEMREQARMKAKEIRQNKQADREQAATAAKAQREQARMRAKEIRQNKREIKELRETKQEKTKLARELIKTLRENPESFPEEKAVAVREQLRLIKENREKFAESLGRIRDESASLRENRRNNNAPGMKGNADNIFAVQEARIQILKEMITDLDELLALLT